MTTDTKAGLLSLLMCALYLPCIFLILSVQEAWTFLPIIPVVIFDFAFARPYMRRNCPEFRG